MVKHINKCKRKINNFVINLTKCKCNIKNIKIDLTKCNIKCKCNNKKTIGNTFNFMKLDSVMYSRSLDL